MTNYEKIMDKMTPEVLAVLISQDVLFNSCLLCEKGPISYKGVCDHKCYTHIKAWLYRNHSDSSAMKDLLEVIDHYSRSDSAKES